VGEILLVLESHSEAVKMYALHRVVKNNPRSFGDVVGVMREPRGIFNRILDIVAIALNFYLDMVKASKILRSQMAKRIGETVLRINQ
jgi:hypothetical protein